MNPPLHLIPGTLTSGFHGHAANDDAPLPHEMLQEILDGCLHALIHDFDESMRSLLGQMNLDAQLDRQSTRHDTLPSSIYLEVGVGDPIPREFWQLAVTSYHDRIFDDDIARFKALCAHLDEDAWAHTLATKRYKNLADNQESMRVFSRAFVEDIRVFALARRLFRDKIQGVDISWDMHYPSEGFVQPKMIITQADEPSDLRLLVQRYVESKQGKRHLSLSPA